MQLGVISRSQRGYYYRELKDVVSHCLRTDRTEPLRKFIRCWIRKGAPIDPDSLLAPAPTIAVILRQLCVALNISAYKADALLWLSMPQCRYSRPGESLTLEEMLRAQRAEVARFKPYSESFVPWNLALFAPKDTPYEAFNSQGFTLEYTEGT